MLKVQKWLILLILLNTLVFAVFSAEQEGQNAEEEDANLSKTISIKKTLGQKAAKDMVSVQAMRAYEDYYDNLMENIVNVKTPGYKSLDGIIFTDDRGNILTKRSTRYTKGSFVETNRNLDVAIEGDGFFEAQSPDWGTLYTRDGRFTVDRNSQLVTMAGGFPVVSNAGAIYLADTGGSDLKVHISPEGSIVQNNNEVGAFKIVTFEDLSWLERVNGSFFRFITANATGPPIEQESYRLKVGYYESSNVDLSKQLIDLPLNSRKYDANSKALQILKRAKQSGRELGRAQ
jgi:flagellar basal body rod protein FlgG